MLILYNYYYLRCSEISEKEVKMRISALIFTNAVCATHLNATITTGKREFIHYQRLPVPAVLILLHALNVSILYSQRTHKL